MTIIGDGDKGINKWLLAILTSAITFIMVALGCIFFLNISKSNEKQERMGAYITKAKRLLSSFSVAHDLSSGKPENQEVEKRREDSIENYMNASLLLEKALEEEPNNSEIKTALSKIYKEVGLSAMAGKNYILSKIVLERYKNLGNKEEAERLIALIPEKKENSRKEDERKKEEPLFKPPERDTQVKPLEIAQSEMDEVKESLRRGDIEDAMITLSQATETNGRFAEAYFNRGRAKEDRQEKDLALSEYSKAIQYDKKMAKAYNSRGRLLMEKNKIEDALGDFNYAIHLDPKYAEAYRNRGFIREIKSEMARARDDYQMSVRLDANYIRPYCDIGNTYIKENDIDKAIFYFSKAIQLRPEYVEAYNDRGGAKFRKGDLKGALEDYNKAIEIAPNKALTYYHRAMIYLQQKKQDDADKDLVQFMKLDPNNPEAENLRNYLKDKGKWPPK